MTTTLILAVLIGLATYRLWRLIAQDQITERLRVWERTGGPVAGFVDDLVSCVWCLGLWIAATLTAITASGFAEWMVVTLAASTIAGVVESLIKREEPNR